jgi:pyroglutamyl-peptidase
MRILIYGFGPYRQFRDNVTATVVRRLPRQRGLRKIVFPVRFHKAQFIRVLKDFRPDVVLGLGQCSGGRVLRQERRALNRRRNFKSEKPRSIIKAGPLKIFTNLELNLGRHARISRHAGDYVCNFSMYVMLDYIKRRQLPALYGFVHVPHDYDPEKAVTVLGRALTGSKFKVQGSRSKLRQNVQVVQTVQDVFSRSQARTI